MKRRKIIKALWVLISFVVVVSMVAWTVMLGF
ncbi:MAG: hypothetical protein UV95_C0001G0211 [Candidatus Falkowbacteria bacterium GW2011_GWF2_43_32]|jgi:hypothetical protein|nr:MAG: hypothetical protein UV95_C0001G0211 [Candidatus Falkowbacteria bacterium GW2011_GWF2_43_32]